jgi:hypothetical protein
LAKQGGKEVGRGGVKFSIAAEGEIILKGLGRGRWGITKGNTAPLP